MLKLIIGYILDWTLGVIVRAYKEYQARVARDAAIKKAAADAVKKLKELKPNATKEEVDAAIDDALSNL
jgi:hypothetical protein